MLLDARLLDGEYGHAGVPGDGLVSRGAPRGGDDHFIVVVPE